VVVWGSDDAGAVAVLVWGVSLAARVERSATAGGAVYALSELPGRTFLVGTQREAGLLNADAPAGVSRTLQVPKGDEVWATAVRPGGEWIALGGKAEDGRGWLALTRPDGRDFRRLALPRPARSLSFSPAGTPLLAGTADAEAGGVREYDTSDPLAPVLVRENALGPAWAVAFSHDGTRYATSAGYGEVRVWNASTSQPEGMPLGHPWRAVAIGFSRDGRRLVSASTDRRVRVWDTSNGVLVSESAAHRGAVWAVGVSPDGRLFATGGRDGCVRLWNAETGAPLGTPLRHPGPVWAVTFNRDGSDLWSGGEGTRDACAVRRWLAPVTSLKVPDAHAEAWAETATGSRLDGDRVRVLSPAEWRERRDRLTAAGVSW
jgi:WD40 repeat protein